MHHQAVAWYAPATAKLHKKALPSVPASQSQAPFVAATASRPTGEGNTFLCKIASAGAGRVSRRRLPGRIRALAPSAVRPMCRPAPGHWSVRLRAVVAVSGLSAGHHVLAPAHPCASPLRGISTARVPIRPPRGLPQARAALRACLLLKT